MAEHSEADDERIVRSHLMDSVWTPEQLAAAQRISDRHQANGIHWAMYTGHRPPAPPEGLGCQYATCLASADDTPGLNHLRMCRLHITVAHDAFREYVRNQNAQKADPDRGTIYFLQVGSHIKIGWATDLAKRMRAYPPNSILMAVQPGTRAAEAKLHKRFAVHRSHGREWYPLVPAILEHIAAVVRDHGTPDPVAFAAAPSAVPTGRDQQRIRPKRQRPWA